MRGTMVFALLLVVGVGCQVVSRERAASEPEASMELMKAAQQGLSTLAKMVNEQNYRAMGFASANEARAASLGDPVQVFVVRLDSLRQYDASTDPMRLLTPANRMLFPVVVGNDTRSSIALEKDEGGWRAVRFGGAVLSQRLFDARSAPGGSADGSTTMSISVPALNAEFRGVAQGDSLILTSLVDDPSLDLKVGLTLPAGVMFARLVPAAQAHDGQPR